MRIINYKELDKGYYSGLSISKNEVNGYYSFCEEDGYGRYTFLMPDKDFEGKIESIDQVREYIRDYYINVLSKENPKDTYEALRYQTLVTFDDGEFSHGYIVSAWIELFLEIKVPIIKREMLGNGLYKYVESNNPSWVMDLLEEEIRKTIDDMKGYNSVRALYLFRQSEELDKMAETEEDRLLTNSDWSLKDYNACVDRISDYRQAACYRRCDADMAEDAWKERRCILVENIKKKNKKMEL